MFHRLNPASKSLVETVHMDSSTHKIRMVNQLMADLDMPLSFFKTLRASRTPFHPEIAREFLRWAHAEHHACVDAWFVLDFVENEKLFEFIRRMCQTGGIWKPHLLTAHVLLAIDGLGGDLARVPNMDTRDYLENLKYGLSGKRGRYDREADDDVKRAHVFAVRNVYRALQSASTRDSHVAMGVYHVVRHVLMETGEIGLPCIDDELWNERSLEHGVQTYKETMKDELLNRYVEMTKQSVWDLTDDSPSSES